MEHEGSKRVLLGCDLGEAPAGSGRDRELALLAHVSAASIACGGHAGDEESMRIMAERCAAQGTLIGAHPSFPDRAGFGRGAIEMDRRSLWASIGSQVESLERVCAAAGAPMRYIKAHGALYHACAGDRDCAQRMGRLVLERFPGVLLVGPAGSLAIEMWRSMGIPVIREGFADRVYAPDGGLRPRESACSVIDDPQRAAEQALGLARGGGVVAWDGSVLPLRIDMVCVHCDTPGAPRIIDRVREGLRADGLL